MPTIEIVSIDSKGLYLNQSDFEVAIIEENKLISHRGLFYDFLKTQNGIIVHIGNPDLKYIKAGFFAGLIIDWDFEPVEITIPKIEDEDLSIDIGANQQFKFKFLSKYKSDIDNLLKRAIRGSPTHRVYFLTDYQFGPENANKEIIYTIEELWALHDNKGLVFNTLYELYRP